MVQMWCQYFFAFVKIVAQGVDGEVEYLLILAFHEGAKQIQVQQPVMITIIRVVMTINDEVSK